MTETMHSKLPWRENLPLRSDGAIVVAHIVDEAGSAVAQLHMYTDDCVRANAALIVRAVNERAEILSALEELFVLVDAHLEWATEGEPADCIRSDDMLCAHCRETGCASAKYHAAKAALSKAKGA